MNNTGKGNTSVQLKKNVLSDKAWEKAVWKIRRWNSQEDKKNNVVYSKNEEIGRAHV